MGCKGTYFCKHEARRSCWLVGAVKRIGFCRQYAGKVFTVFQRLNTDNQYTGTRALGLSLCKKIVERHGGSIAAKGVEDVGAVFELLLPLKK